MFFISAKAKRNNQKLERYARRRVAWFLGLTFILSNIVSPIFIMAAPQVFSRPGAGVSRMPLGVSAFNAPGFGELSEAINLANGNVYVAGSAVSRNNQNQEAGATGNTMGGGGGWNTSQRMRLYGFSGNLITNQNVADTNYWNPYLAQPSRTGYRLAPYEAVSPTCTSSGVFHYDASLPNGLYRVFFEGRSTGANLPVTYGLNVGKTINTTLTANWQEFAADFNLTAADSISFILYESTVNNPAWETANIRVYRVNATTGVYETPNLITNQNLTDPYWNGVCTGVKPAITPFDTERFLTTDSVATSNTGVYIPANYSGIFRNQTPVLGAGRYTVSFEGRTLARAFNVSYGLNDYRATNAWLTTNWQTFTTDFDVPAALPGQQDRHFEILEGTLNNPSWQVRNIQVRFAQNDPQNYTLGVGDGSSSSFERFTPPNSSWWATQPSWIQRYQNATNATLYRSQPLAGTQYSQEWIVNLRRADNTRIAHYYAPDGTRVTFDRDGEYADYAQNLHQQYRSASSPNNDSEGAGANSPRTEFEYTGLNSGQISRVKDEWGRITKYFWNGDLTLGGIQELVHDENLTTQWAAKYTNFSYVVMGTQRLISQIQYITQDGKGGTISRTTNFEYQYLSNSIVLKNTGKQILNGSVSRYTHYVYDTAGRVANIITNNNAQSTAGSKLEPDTIYTYNAGGNSIVPNTNEVIITQGTGDNRKETKMYYDPNTSALVQKHVWDYNPSDGQGSQRWLISKYEYHSNGSTSRITLPSGAYTEYIYDTRGNINEIKTFTSSGTPERTNKIEYNNDNLETANYFLAESGTRDTNAAYAYQQTGSFIDNNTGILMSCRLYKELRLTCQAH